MIRIAPILILLLMIATIVSLWLSPPTTPTLGVITLLLSLALSTYGIYTKHKGTEHARAKILKEVGVMVLTLVIILFLGGIVAMLANVQVGMRWGEVAGLVSAIAASFAVGYLVRKGMEDSANASKAVINPLDDGKISFSGPRSVRDLFDINGTRYNPSTLSVTAASKGIFTSAAKNTSVFFSFGVSFVANAIDYTIGENKDKTVLSQEFGVSTVVDTVFAVGVGLVAAGAVAAVLTIAGVGAVVSTPALIALAAVTAGVSIIIGLVVDVWLNWPSQVKYVINYRID